MTSLIIEEMLATFRGQKRLAERAIAQLTDDQVRTPLSPETNSVAVIIKHMAGNMISRWSDFLTSDGEKAGRDRDSEFVDTFSSHAEILATWEAGWAHVFSTLGSLADDDLCRRVTIRGQELSVARAIVRQIDHYGYHVGQIVLIARMMAKDRWQVLTIARGGSEQYTRAMLRGNAP